MSELIFSWLNDEVQLSKKIVNFEQDFANGFYFGELLFKYNQQLNFKSEFKNSDQRQDKLKNFNQLYPTFNTLKVKFESQIVDRIITKEKGVAEQILYQLKMALEKVNNPADIVIFTQNNKFNQVTPLKKIEPPREQYDKMKKEFFSRRLNEMNKPQKAVNQTEHLAKFEHFRIRELAKQQVLQEKDEQKNRSLKEEVRKIQLNKLQRGMAFQEDWQQKGKQNHKKNMEVKKKREEDDTKFRKTQLERTQQRSQLMHELQKNELYSDIQQFMQNLAKRGIKQEEDSDSDNPEKPDKEENPEFRKTKDPKIMVSAAATISRIKEQKAMRDWVRKERDKRRRKMIVDQSKIQRDIEVEKREQHIIEKLKQESRQEKEIEYEIWRAQQCKYIIKNNREYRTEKYRLKNEKNVLHAKYKEEEMLKTLQAENLFDIAQKMSRLNDLQIQYKQDIHKQHYNQCLNLTNVLVNLAMICFDHQQDRDSQEIDSFFWDQQLQLFKDGKPQIPTINSRNYDIIKNLRIQQSSSIESKQALALKELNDYLNGLGQWIPQHKKEGDNETDEKFVPDKPMNNTQFGDIVTFILEQNFQDQVKIIQNYNKTTPDNLAIKLAITGYQFSGKKTIADYLNKKYGIHILQMDRLINDLLLKIKDDNGQGEDSELKLAREIQQLLLEGQNITDELYMEVLALKLSELFPKQTNDQFLEEYQKASQQQPDKQKLIELSKITETQLPLTSEDLFKQNLINIEYKYTKGYILIDFPQTYEQAILLENKLCNFKPYDMQTKTELEAQLEKLTKIVKPSEIKTVKRKLVRNGIDHVFFINVSDRESLRRALGRRIDANIGAQYHLDDNIPPIDNAPLIEKLQEVVSQDSSDLALVDKNCELDAHKQEIKELFEMFGYQLPVKVEEVVQQPQQAAEKKPEEAAENKTEEVVEKKPEETAEKQPDEVAEKKPEELQKNPQSATNQPKPTSADKKQDVKKEEKQPEKEEGEKPKTEDNKETEKDQEQQQQQQQPQQQKEEQKVVKKKIEFVDQVCWQEIDGQCKIDELFYKVDNQVKNILKQKQYQYQKMIENKQADVENQKQQEEIEKIKKQNENKWLFTDEQNINNSVAIIEKQFQINPIALSNMYKLWNTVQNRYLGDTSKIFTKIRDQKELLVSRFAEIQRRFLELLQRPDSKFHLMRNYQETYNKFLDENLDMCEQDNTKEELHQRVENLLDNLYEIIQNKKDTAMEERSQIMKSSWIENDMESFLFNLIFLIQTELQRSFISLQLISDFYQLKNNLDIQEVPEYYKSDFIQNFENLPPVEQEGDPNVFPRLDKIIDLAMKFYYGEEEVPDDKGKKGGPKGGQPQKKEDKKGQKKGGKDLEEQQKVENPQEQEMKKLLLIEKNIFKYRLFVIKNYGISKLKEMRAMANVLYGKLEDWIFYNEHIENQATFEMSLIFRNAIENIQKIQKEIQLNYVDVIVSHQTLNFLTPPPIILPAKEYMQDNRFTISQLYVIIEEIKGLVCKGNVFIENTMLLQYFNRKLINKLSVVDFPKIWRGLKLHDIQILIQTLDIEKNGYVNYRDLCTYICLINSPLATIEEDNEYKKNLQQNSKNGKIQKHQFVQTPAWFDQYQNQQEEINTNKFERAQYLKELLFYINKETVEKEEVVNVEQFLFALSCMNYIDGDTRIKLKDYNELLFMSQEK